MNKPFNLSKWTDLMTMIGQNNITLLRDTYDQPTGINIRHDIDADLDASIDMARLENHHGIRSTYFFLNTAGYWSSGQLDSAVKIIHTLGHEIGWHNNAITESIKTGKPLERCIIDPLERLRQYADVVGSASHGDPKCHELRYLNYYAFKECELHKEFAFSPTGRREMKRYGLKYEAYHTGFTHYLSDSGGNWQQDNTDLITDFQQSGKKLQVLLHPQWWQL
jgi:hypothetical protein